MRETANTESSSSLNVVFMNRWVNERLCGEKEAEMPDSRNGMGVGENLEIPAIRRVSREKGEDCVALSEGEEE